MTQDRPALHSEIAELDRLRPTPHTAMYRSIFAPKQRFIWFPNFEAEAGFSSRAGTCRSEIKTKELERRTSYGEQALGNQK